MPDVKLNVTADLAGVNSAVNKQADQVSSANQKMARSPKVSPIDLKQFEKDLAKQRQMYADHLKKMQSMAGGGAGATPTVPSKGSSAAPSIPSPLVEPGARRRGRYTYSPDISDVGRNLFSGFGGGVGMVSQYATRGAVAGANAEGGGMLGGAAGLLKGIGIGTLALGALKLGQMGSEGMDMAKERSGTLDSLKRQMGDLGISFSSLRVMSDAVSEGMQVNSKEMASLALDFNKLSAGAEKTAEGVFSSTRSGAKLSSAYGLEPSAGVNYLAGMRRIDPKQNNRDLAVVLADTIHRSGMSANADQVMQAIQSFASATSRISLAAPNIGAFGSGYSSMMGSGYRGMTGDVASGIISQANSSVQRMGGAGEAGMNFMHSAFGKYGYLSPVQSMALAEGGLFGTRRDVFSKDGALAAYYAKQGVSLDSLAGGKNAGVTNIDAIRAHLDRMGGSADMKLEGFKNLMGMSSLSQAAALYNMDSSTAGGLGKLVSRNHLELNGINEGGIQNLSAIGNASSTSQLKSIYEKMEKRTGKNALTDDDKAAWAAAMKDGGMEKMQDALAKMAASSDREETEFSNMTESIKAIESAEIRVGEKLLIPLNTMRDALVGMSGSKSVASLHQKFIDNERSDIDDRYSDKEKDIKGRYLSQRYKAMAGNGSPQSVFDEINSNEKRELEALNLRKQGEVDQLEGNVKKSLYDALLDQESGNRHRDKDGHLITSPKGAQGISQVMPSTGIDPGYGIKPLQNDSEAEYRRVGHQYLDAMRGEFGNDPRKAVAAYNMGPGALKSLIGKYHDDWYSHVPDETHKYTENVMSHWDGSMPMEEPRNGGGGGGGAVDHKVEITLKSKTDDGRGGTKEKIVGKTVVPLARASGTQQDMHVIQ